MSKGSRQSWQHYTRPGKAEDDVARAEEIISIIEEGGGHLFGHEEILWAIKVLQKKQQLPGCET